MFLIEKYQTTHQGGANEVALNDIGLRPEGKIVHGYHADIFLST